MINHGKRDVAGVMVDAVDYEYAVSEIIAAAKGGRGFTVSALAVHGVMTGVGDPEHRYRLNSFDLIVPDGQPVRWALNMLHGLNLADRVYGPNLTLYTCEAAAREGLAVYLYGSRQEVLDALQARLREKFPSLVIAGAEPSKFRRTSPEEKAEIAERIKRSGAAITLVGLGCPRQEVWAYEYRDALSMPILAVGAAFDFHAGLLEQAPREWQDRGLEWLFRLTKEPKRLWKRYLLLNPAYAGMVALQALKVPWSPSEPPRQPKGEILYG
ncbi:MAG TPA: WecB/TagA/CpsF family glycosyltransferase [Deinococcales bacterium]|nr:WecB/TagA/CpsF family glycosyltransferase [Deinococcales bacterium]